MANLDQALVFQFEQDYELLFQQLEQRLRQYARMKTGLTGTMTAFGLLGPGDVQDITGEHHGETTFVDDPSYRRWAVKRDYEGARMLDASDMLEVIVDLEMGYARNVISALNRKADKVLVDAVTGTVVTGATGTSTSAFNTAAPVNDGSGGNQIASGGTGLLLDKMRTARAIFDAREVGVDEMNMGESPFVWITNAAGHQDLLEQTEIVSGDYIGIDIVNGREVSSRMPLVRGRVPYMMGFRIVIINNLNLSGTDYLNLAWHRDAMGFAVWGGRRMWVGDLPTRHLARGVIVQEHFGATRIHDLGVLAIACAP